MTYKSKIKYSILAAAGGLSLLGGAMGAGAAGANLLLNGDFDGGIAPWTSAPGTPWAEVSGKEDLLKVTNNAPWDLKTFALAVQCVPVEAFEEYQLDAISYLPSGQAREGGAQATMTFNTGANCDGAQLTTWETGTAAQPDTWANLSLTRTAPAGAQSALVGLSATKNKPFVGQDWEAPLTVYFDNVSFGAASDEPEPVRGEDEEGEGPVVLEEPEIPDDGPVAEPEPDGEPDDEPKDEPTLEGDPDAGPPDEPEVEGDEPQDEPGDGPQDEPGDQPQDEPGDEPQDEPGDEPQDEPGDEPLGDEPLELDEPAEDVKSPLPPDTGTGFATESPDLMLAAGVVGAAMAVALGGAMLMPAKRKR